MTIFIVAGGGYYQNPDNVPRALRWLPQASLIKHSFEAFCVNEFPGLTFKSETKAGKRLAGPDESGEQVWGLHCGRCTTGNTAPVRVLWDVYVHSAMVVAASHPEHGCPN